MSDRTLPFRADDPEPDPAGAVPSLPPGVFLASLPLPADLSGLFSDDELLRLGWSRLTEFETLPEARRWEIARAVARAVGERMFGNKTLVDVERLGEREFRLWLFYLESQGPAGTFIGGRLPPDLLPHLDVTRILSDPELAALGVTRRQLDCLEYAERFHVSQRLALAAASAHFGDGPLPALDGLDERRGKLWIVLAGDRGRREHERREAALAAELTAAGWTAVPEVEWPRGSGKMVTISGHFRRPGKAGRPGRLFASITQAHATMCRDTGRPRVDYSSYPEPEPAEKS